MAFRADMIPPPAPRAAATLRVAFETLLELPPTAREDWLEHHVPTQKQRRALRRLLAADAAQGALDTPAAERAARLGEVEFRPSALVGRRIGGFRLLAPLGQGGMAAVFLAERDDPQCPQRVALKLLRRGLYSEFEQRLFRRERQALAALSHPDIARLIDGGVTEAGIPYLVLELVEGEPITAHAAAYGLGLRARLALFARVCRAVAAAHRALVVHRDLKPDNILVDREGRPRLLDFGIAKLLDDDDTGATGTGLAALTPGYAAPEQYGGGPATPATDVYALGVLLHELLTGQRPGERRGRGVAPGLALEPSALRRARRGDLDTLLACALAVEPARRYASAAELADDVERHLQAHPIAAHPPSRRYRLGKFARRHRVGVALVAAFAFGVLASLGLALWQAREAHLQAQRAGQVQDFLEALFEPIEDGRAAPTLDQLLQRGLQRLPAAGEGDARLRAELLAMFARIRDGVGDTAANRALAHDAWRAAAAAWGPDDARTLEARALYGRVLRKLGEFDAALAEYQAVRTAMRARGIGGQDYARLLDAISIVRMAQGMDPAEAIALKQEILQVRLTDPQATPDDLQTGWNNLGAAYQYAARFDEALQAYARALEAGRPLGGGARRADANTLANIGHVLSYQGRWREAAETLDAARERYAQAGVARGEGLAALLLRQCMVLSQLEWHTRASERCDEAVAMTREVHGAAHPNHAFALARRAGAAVAAGALDEAAAGYAAARAILVAAPGDQRYAAAIVDADQARLWRARGDWAALRDAALAQLDAPARRGAPHPGTRAPSAPLLAAWAALACARAPAPACGQARVAAADAVLADPAFARSVLRYGAALALARLALDRGEPRAALARLDAAAPWAESELDPVHSWRVQWHALRADALRALGQGGGARAEANEAGRLRAALPPGHWLRRAASTEG